MWSNLCKDDCVLSVKRLKQYLTILLWKSALALNKLKYPNIHFNLCRYDRDDLDVFLKHTKVGLNLTVRWNGKVYKNLLVSIDLTPAIPIVVSEEQIQQDFNAYAIKELSADRRIHVVPYTKYEERLGWRPSFSLLEVRILKRLTKKQLSLYKCLKFLRDLHGDVLAPIPSYHLKTLLLTSLFQEQDEQKLKLLEQENFYSSISRVLLLLKQLAEYPLDERRIQHFFLKFRMSLVDYDIRWCECILEHLQSN